MLASNVTKNTTLSLFGVDNCTVIDVRPLVKDRISGEPFVAWQVRKPSGSVMQVLVREDLEVS